MFSGARTLLVEDHDATLQNLKLLLSSDKFSLFGDPFYGMVLKRALYEENNTVLKDLLIDEIYTAVMIFMPQVRLQRKDIKIKQEKDKIYAELNCINLLNYVQDTYSIQLLDENTNL